MAVITMHINFLTPPAPFLTPPSTLHFSLSPFSWTTFLSVENFTQRSPFFTVMSFRPPNILVTHCTKKPSNAFIDTGMMLFSLLEDIGIEEKGAKLLLENHPGLNSVPFETIRTRIQSLEDIGFDGLALSKLILKRPDVLTAKEMDSFTNYLRNKLKGDVELIQLQRLFNTTEPRFLVGFEEKVGVLVYHGLPEEQIVYVLNNVKINKAFCLKSREEIERMVTYLNRFGGVEFILRRPAVLNYDLDTQIIPRISFLLELSGGNEDATATVLNKLPFILAYTVEHLKDHVEFLISFAGLTDQEIFRIILVYPNVFSASRDRKLKPRIEFLKECGLSSNDIFKFLIKAPLFVSLSFEGNLAHKLVLLVKIGYSNKTKELAMAMGSVTRTSYKNMQAVISLFLNYGLTCEDIFAMGKKHPQILQYNHKSLDEKMEYLVEDMGREIGELLAFPAFLGYQLDGRIKHRYEVTKHKLGEGMSLNKLLSVSTESFSTRKKKKKYPVKASSKKIEMKVR
ncbi:Plastid transcriptionally active 15 [Heracleum sosnowskyi]|uniref:Plastid transcriptionally active 15 n=1 Tax=Heracleum sosnowskyi TaxID=360622 RepID=A0AAD8J818_9APIA|nr:Plastid transcriptionally active 15 [Heracleum sosnowskyi]